MSLRLIIEAMLRGVWIHNATGGPDRTGPGDSSDAGARFHSRLDGDAIGQRNADYLSIQSAAFHGPHDYAASRALLAGRPPRFLPQDALPEDG